MIMVFGASSKRSLGYLVGESWKLSTLPEIERVDNRVYYASRSGRLGRKCDITRYKQVGKMFRDIAGHPSAVIQAAGVYTPARRLGESLYDPAVHAHILAKSVGTMNLLDAAVRSTRVRNFIVFGGREMSSNPGYVFYTAANGAMWSLVQFANRHTRLRAYFIDLPLVERSAMGKKFLADPGVDVDPTGVIPVQVVTDTVTKIMRGEVEPGRIILGEGWTV